MNRAERLAILSTLLEGLEIQAAQAELEARLEINGWDSGESAWLKRALERVQAMNLYVSNRRRKAAAPQPQEAAHHG